MAAPVVLAAIGAVGVFVAIRAFDDSARDVADGYDALRDATAVSRGTDFRTSWQQGYVPSERVRSAAGADDIQLEIARRAFGSALFERDTADARRGLAGVLILRRNYSGAIEELERVRALEPADAAILVDLAVARAGANELRGARAALDDAARLEPKRLDVRFNIALVFERLGDAPAARDAWQNYLELDPASEWAAEARVHLESLAGSTKSRR